MWGIGSFLAKTVCDAAPALPHKYSCLATLKVIDFSDTSHSSQTRERIDH